MDLEVKKELNDLLGKLIKVQLNVIKNSEIIFKILQLLDKKVDKED